MQGPHSVTHAQRAGLLTEMVPCRIRTELKQIQPIHLALSVGTCSLQREGGLWQTMDLEWTLGLPSAHFLK